MKRLGFALLFVAISASAQVDLTGGNTIAGQYAVGGGNSVTVTSPIGFAYGYAIDVAGGASVLSGPDSFQIGERNAVAVRRTLAVYGCRLAGFEVGGVVNRTLHLNVGTGELTVKMPDRTFSVALA